MCRELSASRALRRLLVSCPWITAPNQEAMAKCAARALFLSPSWERRNSTETKFPRDQTNFPKKHAASLIEAQRHSRIIWILKGCYVSQFLKHRKTLTRPSLLYKNTMTTSDVWNASAISDGSLHEFARFSSYSIHVHAENTET